MRNIQDIIKKLNRAQIREIQNIFGIKDPARNISGLIYARLISHPGMAEMISHLNQDERKILNLAFDEKDGITYEEIGKRLSLDINQVERYAGKLISMLLVYVLKNRQKLSNKLDKVYLLPEIYNTLNPLTEHFINDNFSDICESLFRKEARKKDSINIKKQPSAKYLDFIFNSGGIVFLEEFETLVPKNSLQKTLSDLLKSKYVHIFHDLSFSGKTMIVLDKKTFIQMAENLKKTNANPVNVRNRYNTLLNILKTYDSVSTFGLFLTKQNQFRKIDRRHLEESMIKIFGISGSEIDPSVISQLSLYFLNIQDCITIENNSAIISLKNISDLIDDPFNWIISIIKTDEEPLKNEKLFNPQLEIPGIKSLLPVIKLIKDYNNNVIEYIEAVFTAKSYSGIKNHEFMKFWELRQNNKKTFRIIMNYLCITGIIQIENSRIILSDIGKKIADREISKTEKIPATAVERKNLKNIYLNPDFTLIIPKEDISSDALYHILTHTEIIKDDIILHTRISRESILTALKREMDNKNFFSTLRKTLKTEIPDNLHFLISEWLNQTVRIRIFNACIINANDSFLDKISHSKIKNCIVKRLADQYAIIDRKYLDKLIKMAKESDAVINLFDKPGE